MEQRAAQADIGQQPRLERSEITAMTGDLTPSREQRTWPAKDVEEPAIGGAGEAMTGHGG